jgi:hypothetical protein
LQQQDATCLAVYSMAAKADSEQAAYRSGEPLRHPKIKCHAVPFAIVEKNVLTEGG